MLFKSISLTNFMPFCGKHELVFASDKNQMVTLIVGDNMRGKTSLLNAIRFCLYASSLDRARREIALYKLINRDAWQKGDRFFELALRFSFEGGEYDLRRKVSFPFSAPQSPRDNLADSQKFLLRDGVAISADQIERVIARCAPQQTSRFLLFDAELLSEYEELVSVGQGQGDRIRREIENQLGIPIIQNGIAHFRHLRSEHVKRAQDVVSTNAVHKNQQNEHRRQFEIVESCRLERDGLVREKSDIDSKIALVNDQMSEHEEAARLLSDLRAQTRQLEYIRSEESEALERFRAIVPDLWRDVLCRAVAPSIKKFKQQELDSLSAEVDAKVRLQVIADIKSAVANEMCSLCGQRLNRDLFALMNQRLSSLSSVPVAAVAPSEFSSHVSAALSQLTSLEFSGCYDRLKEASETLSRLRVERHRFESTIEEINRQIGGINQVEVESLARQRFNLGHQLGSVESALEVAERKLQEHTSELDRRWKLLSKLTPSTGLEEKEAKICEEMLELFTCCQASYRESLRVEIESSASRAFAELTTEREYTGLSINANYGLTILDSAGREVSLRSAGAEQIVALALIDALAKTTARSAPIIIDTPFARLDLKHRENVLRYLPQMAPQVILFVHEGEYLPESSTPITTFIGRRYRIDRITDSTSEVVLI